MEIKSKTPTTKTEKIPPTRAAYALALIQAGHENVVTIHDQKRLLAQRLVTLAKGGALTLTVRGMSALNGSN